MPWIWIILFEASTRQDDPKNGEETWIGLDWVDIETYFKAIAQHVKNERSDL